jgi:tetratricopeptide (TPR) repeat protein
MGQAKRLPFELEALSQLLRNIDDRIAISCNLVVASYLEENRDSDEQDPTSRLVHLRVRGAILRAVASLDVADPGSASSPHPSRQRAIITRCDLGGEKHAFVARSLGICLRHFYRERRVALERLTAAIRREFVAAATPVATPPSLFELDLDRIATLQLVGQFTNAYHEIEAIARSATSLADAVRAWCYGVEIAALVDDTDRALQFLAEAVEATRGISDDHELVVAAADVEMACGFAAWQKQDFVRAVQAVENSVHNARRLPRVGNQARIRATIGVFLRGAELACMQGNVREALSRLGDARSILDGMPHRPPDLLGQLFLELSIANGLVCGGIDRAIEYATDALEVFRSAGMSVGVADAAGVLCAQYTAGASYERAIQFGQLAVQIARANGSAADLADHVFSLAQAESLGGNPTRALALAKHAGTSTAGALYGVRALIAVAEAHLKLGNHRAAQELGERARDVVSAQGWERIAGIVSLIRAEANDGLGDRRDAVEQIDQSIEHLARHGDPFPLKRAYAFSARLTGRQDHQRIARELEGTLTIHARSEPSRKATSKSSLGSSYRPDDRG